MITKHASGSFFGKAREVMKDPGSWMALSAMAPLAGAAIGLGAGGVKMLNDRVQKNRSYKEMFEHNPSLRERDPATVRRMFSTLERLGPELAKDPVVAGAWINHTLVKNDAYNTVGPNEGVLQTAMALAGVSKDIDARTRNKSHPLISGMETGGRVVAPAREALKNFGEGPATLGKLRTDLDGARDGYKAVSRENAALKDLLDAHGIKLSAQKTASLRVKKAAAHFKHLR